MSDNKNDEITFFAETNFRGQKRKFGIKTDDRRRHMYLIGKTGMGKTNALENMIYCDIMAGKGVGYVDPHGDTAEKILNFIPASRINDVVYFNPSDMAYPVAFNILETIDEEHKHLVASGLMGVFKKIWPDVWSARMEYILNNTILALLDYPGSSMLGIQKMLSDKAFRKKVVSKITDPVVKSFWIDEFAKYNDRFAQEAIAPIQNKVGQFLSAAIIRNIVGQVKSTIDMHDIMDNKKIFIMNLSKGRIGEDNSMLLGGMLITKLQLAAMERVNIPEEQRKDFYLYVDEFQNFATESFANILSEARKYRLNLIMAHQYITQLDETVRDAVFGNVGTLISFRVGAADAEFLVKEFTPRFTEEDLVNLPKFNVYLKLMIDGVSSDPFSAGILPPLSKIEGNVDKIINVSRERYSKQRAEIEDKIARWVGVAEEPASQTTKSVTGPEKMKAQAPRPVVKKTAPVKTFQENNNKKDVKEDSNLKTSQDKEKKPFIPPAPPKNFVPKSEKVIEKKTEDSKQEPPSLPAQPSQLREDNQRDKFHPHEAKCSECDKHVYVSFKPDGKRNVYCQDCFKKVREQRKSKEEEMRKIKEAVLRGQKVVDLSDENSLEPQPRGEITLSDILKKEPVGFKKKGKEKKAEPIPDGWKEKEDKKKVELMPNVWKSTSKPTLDKPLPSSDETQDGKNNDDFSAKAVKPGEVIEF